MIEVIRNEAILASLQSVRRQYLVGDLKRPQEIKFLRSMDLEIGITRYTQIGTEDPHWHTEATEYQYVLSGWTSYLETDSGEEHEFREGDFYVIFPGTTYAQKAKSGTAILFIKVPSINDKQVISPSEDVVRWLSAPIKTVRRDYFHQDDAPSANSIRPAAAVAVIVEHRVLLVRRTDNAKWSLPGGTLEMNESLPECAVREVREETGLDVHLTDILNTYTDPDVRIAYSDGEVRREFTIVYVGTTSGYEVVLDSESSEYCWFSLDELSGLDVALSQERRLQDLVDYLNNGKKQLT